MNIFAGKSSFDRSYSHAARLMLGFLLLFALGCGVLGVGETARPSTTVIGAQKSEVSRGTLTSSGGTITGPGGVAFVFPDGAVAQPGEYVFSTIIGRPVWMAAGDGQTPAGSAVDFTLSQKNPLTKPVEIRLPITTVSGVDSSFYTIYAYDGVTRTDIGGLVEGGMIKTWTTHFTSFWPVRDPAPHRPIGFDNSGWYNARIVVAGYRPDPNYAPAAFPLASTVSFVLTAPAAPNPSRYLLLPVGAYTFCVDWTDGKDENKDGYFDYYHSYTPLVDILDSDPRPLDLAKRITITPGREAKFETGPCGTTAAPNAATWLNRTRTPTFTSIADNRNITHTITPTTRITTEYRTPTRTATTVVPPTRVLTTAISPKATVNYIPYRDAWLKRCDDLRAEYQKINCNPPYSGCFEDIFGMPTSARSYLYNSYWVNVHRSYVTFAQSLEDQLLAELRKCFAQFVSNRQINLDVRKGQQSACIGNVVTMYDTEIRRIMTTSCQAGCGEKGKTGVVEGVPAGCTCK